ncbi:type II secretion protein F [Cellulomonas rhizosphaerae]|uniref:type II secretion protein F n=1 Tax=Cellulomonas rhizosphaerae TaxID=2293719 RepID=UPI001F37BC08|nr:type II secretion protein F [Cellulomonas rhizosphaerae]
MIGAAVIVGVLTWFGLPRRRRGRSIRLRARDDARPVVLSAALLVVAAQLRAGSSPEDSWRRALGPGVSVRDGVPDVSALVGPARRRSAGGGDASRAAAVVVAAGVARSLGAPLAGVLEHVAGSVAAEEEAAAELDAALAGPRATARVLAWLPVLGLVVAGLLGADPLAVVLGGGIGTASAVLGAGLLVLGRLWTRGLLRRAGAGRVGG